MRPRVILHADMNAYFASVEQKANPRLRGRPIVIVGDLRRRSVVLTSSYEARAYGVKTGMLFWEAKRLCPQVIPVVGDPGKYRAQTREIIALLERYTDRLEVASIDEGYLDVTGSLRLFKTDGRGIAQLIQTEIRDKLELPCSIGVAPNKLLAKLGSNMKKPMGIAVIRAEDVAGLMENLPVEELCGIGPRFKERLNRIGIRTCGQLGAAARSLLEGEFGFWGYWMGRWGRGEDDRPVVRADEDEAVKSVGHSTTLPRDTVDPKIIYAFLLLLAEKVGVRLRRAGLKGRTVTLTIRDADFHTRSMSRTVGEHLADGPAIAQTARRTLRDLWAGEPLRLLGIGVSKLIAHADQAYLLGGLEKERRLVRAMDAINEKYGRRTLRRAAVLDAEDFGVLEPPIPPQMRAS
ncbi:MAG: DNA polymerase IV [Elusimicrobiota bacterium]